MISPLKHLVGGADGIRVIARDPSKLPAEPLARVEIVEGSHGDHPLGAFGLEAPKVGFDRRLCAGTEPQRTALDVGQRPA